MKWTSGLALCCIVSASLVQGAPAPTERRISRDLDKIDGLRARLLRLQNQIDSLEVNEENRKTAEGGRETGSRNDVHSNVMSAKNDVSRRHPVNEAQMTSERQQRVQTLARQLDEGTNSDLQALAETLDQLLRQTADEHEEPQRTNSAGEYLGDNYKGFRERTATYRPTHAEDMDNDSDDSDDNGDEGSRLRSIYNMLLKLYNDQQFEELAVKARTSQHRNLPDNDPQSHRSVPSVHMDEGTFGDFADEGSDDDRPTATSAPSRARYQEMRATVLAAIESKLQRDVQDARDAGFSIDDIIQDIQNKGEQVKKNEKLRAIESELNELAQRRS